MNATTVRVSLIALSLSMLGACAEARPAGSPADTDLSVVDEGGSSLPGEYKLWSPRSKDECTTSNSSCSVNLAEGDYYLTFKKLHGGRLAAAGGTGSTGGERATGCLRARVHLVPGQEIVCKKVAEFNCSREATETMNCGAASAAKNGPGAKSAAPNELPPDGQ